MTTFCIALKEKLVVATCPLAKGACLWQHRQTLKCRYTAEELSEAEFCARVGAPEVTEAERAAIMEQLKSALRG